MKKNIVIISAIILSFCLGFAVNSLISKQISEKKVMKKVTGIGGIFFKSKDPKQMKEWYKNHLGINADNYGANFEWRENDNPSKKGSTIWSPFSETTKYFDPSEKEFMINYRVDNLEALVEQLKLEGVTILDKMESYDYGKFIHILDNEGNKVELWEPIDSADDKKDN